MSDKDAREFLDYYRLKQKYEDKFQRQKMKILRDDALSNKEKRQRIRLIPRHCVHCKKEGGTLFSSDKGVLRAICGNKSESCDLNLEIQRGDYEDMREIKRLFLEDINLTKSSIIQTKLNLLFNYDDEATALKAFNSLRKNLNQYSKPYEIVQNSYLSIVNNLPKLPEIAAREGELFVLKEELKNLIAQYYDNPQLALVRDMTELYIEKIQPLVTCLRTLKYQVNEIEKKNTDVVKLVQEPYSLDSLFINLEGV